MIAVDSAYCFCVNDDWSGASDGTVDFIMRFIPTHFYYTSDGMNNLGGEINSVIYEIIGNVSPIDASIDINPIEWSSIELYDSSRLLYTGKNLLQIMAISEHAPR